MVWRCNAVNPMPRSTRYRQVSNSKASDPLFAALQYEKAEGHELFSLSQCSEQKTGLFILVSGLTVTSALGSPHFITRRGTTVVWRFSAVNSMPSQLAFDPLFTALLLGLAEGHELQTSLQCSEQKTGDSLFLSSALQHHLGVET